MKFSTLLLIVICMAGKLHAQFTDNDANRTTKRLFIDGSVNTATSAWSGVSLFYNNGVGYLEASTNTLLLPLYLNSKQVTVTGANANDTASQLVINGATRFGLFEKANGDLILQSKRGVLLSERLKNKNYNSIQPIGDGDVLVNSYWGTAININGGLAGDNANATEAVVKGTTSFTINSFSGATQLKTLFTVRNNGNVGIGTTAPTELLSVNGTVLAKRLKVTATGWADFVFDEDYQLPSLKETAAFIKANKHLPEIPTAAEVKENGQDVGEMNRLLLKKVEELTLHLIELQAKVERLEAAQK